MLEYGRREVGCCRWRRTGERLIDCRLEQETALVKVRDEAASPPALNSLGEGYVAGGRSGE